MFNLSPLTLRLAFHEVDNAVDLLKAWDDGKDFRIVPGGPLCSKRDMAKGLTDGISSIWLVSYFHRAPDAVGPLEKVTTQAWSWGQPVK